MTASTSYFKRRKARLKNECIRANVVFGQTLGWVFTLLGAYHYFIQLNRYAWYLLIAGNFLLLLGFGTPEILELPRRILEKIGTLVSGVIFKLLLLILYISVVSPLGFLMQKRNGTAPFYSWEASCNTIEGWTKKISSDEGALINSKSKSAQNYIFQLLGYFQRNGDILILPCLFIGLAWGLMVFFVQTTPLAPMIYALF